MRKLLIKFVLLLTSVSLVVACSSNTQRENTGVGAVTGAVVGGLAGSAIGAGTGQAVAIGAGIVAGALIGGYVGHSMDSVDTARVNSAMDNPTNKTSTWKNHKTGATYSVEPTSKRMTVNGNPNCRKFHTMATMNGKRTQQVHGVACLQSDGTWKAVSSR